LKKENPIQIIWEPDKSQNIPVYQQIINFMCGCISDGKWPVGTRLPSRRELAEKFQVNRSTISYALDELTAWGVLEGHHGAGTYVISNTWSLLLQESPVWNQYVNSGFFRKNSEMIQEINNLEADPEMVRLGTGEPDPRLFPTEAWREAVMNSSSRLSSLGYLEPLGLPELRKALSLHMKTLGIEAPPETILITSGSLQGLQLISACLLKKGSLVYTEAPTYLKSLQVFQSAGLKLTGIPMDKEGIQFWKMGTLLKKEPSDYSSVLYTIPTNHNPTGRNMTPERRRDLLEYCIRNRLPIIEDGAYQELCFSGENRTPLKASDPSGMVIYLGSASKSFAPGLRIGWIIAPEPIVQRLGDAKMQMDYGASSVSQWVFTELLESGRYREYGIELRKELKLRRDKALRVLDQYFMSLADWEVPEGGFYIWLRLKRNTPMEVLFQEAVRSHILLNPGDLYDFAHNHSLRLSYAYTSSDEFERAAQELSVLIRKMEV